MSEGASYAGCLVAVSENAGENLSVKGRIINDTDVIYDGNIVSITAQHLSQMATHLAYSGNNNFHNFR